MRSNQDQGADTIDGHEDDGEDPATHDIDAVAAFLATGSIEPVDDQIDDGAEADDRQRRDQECIHQREVGDFGHAVLDDELVGDE